jgi:hypothetical protein
MLSNKSKFPENNLDLKRLFLKPQNTYEFIPKQSWVIFIIETI